MIEIRIRTCRNGFGDPCASVSVIGRAARALRRRLAADRVRGDVEIGEVVVELLLETA